MATQLAEMIQRIQTIYLFLAVMCAIATFFLPFAHFYANDVKVAEYAMFGVFNVQSDLLEMSGPFTFPTWIFGALGILFPAVAISLYKKRPVQLHFARLTCVLNFSFWIYLFFGIRRIDQLLFSGSLDVLHHIAFYTPVAAFVFGFLAVRGIKQDEALVKSLDRIR